LRRVDRRPGCALRAGKRLLWKIAPRSTIHGRKAAISLNRRRPRRRHWGGSRCSEACLQGLRGCTSTTIGQPSPIPAPEANRTNTLVHELSDPRRKHGRSTVANTTRRGVRRRRGIHAATHSLSRLSTPGGSLDATPPRTGGSGWHRAGDGASFGPAAAGGGRRRGEGGRVLGTFFSGRSPRTRAAQARFKTKLKGTKRRRRSHASGGSAVSPSCDHVHAIARFSDTAGFLARRQRTGAPCSGRAS